jgi:hypothetical protein
VLEASSPTAESPPTNPIPVVPPPQGDANPVSPAVGVEAPPPAEAPAAAVDAPPAPEPESSSTPSSWGSAGIVTWSPPQAETPAAVLPPPPVHDPDSAWWLLRPENDAAGAETSWPRTDPIPVQSLQTNEIPVQAPATRKRKMIFTGLLAVAVLALAFGVTRVGVGGIGEFLSGDERRAVVAADGISTAELNVVTGAETLTIVADGDPGGDLAVATTPAQSRGIPVLEREGARVTLATRDDGRSFGPVEVTVRLARDVRWSVVIDGGARRLLLDLTAGQVAAVDVNEGIGELEARFPRPVGEVRARIGGGAGTVAVQVPDGVPARATFAEGAGDVTLDGEHEDGVAAGTTLASEDWATADDRIDVALDSGVGTVTVGSSTTS